MARGRKRGGGNERGVSLFYFGSAISVRISLEFVVPIIEINGTVFREKRSKVRKNGGFSEAFGGNGVRFFIFRVSIVIFSVESIEFNVFGVLDFVVSGRYFLVLFRYIRLIGDFLVLFRE